MPEKERPITDVALNRKARRNYEILEKLEVGIALSGTEVKTLRNGQISLDESFVKLDDDGLWLIGAHVAEYVEGNIFNHEPTRPRRLLAHAREAKKLGKKAKEKGLTLIPLQIYFRGKWAKLEIALARGRRLHDKRQVMRKREDQRAMRNTKR